jgi:hypothetical protein
VAAIQFELDDFQRRRLLVQELGVSLAREASSACDYRSAAACADPDIGLLLARQQQPLGFS